MKFIAMLKDSLREAIDAKVFYVMVGLSLLLILLASTATFTPTEGGKMVMQMAAIPLSIDLSNLDPSEFQRGGDGGGPDPSRILRRLRGTYQVTEVYPLNNAEDLPDSTFRVLVKQQASLPVFLGGSPPEKIMEQIRERFGMWDDTRIAEVLDVSHNQGTYQIDARLTQAGRRMWPHEFSLFFGALPVFRQGVPLGAQLYALETVLVNQIGAWITILVSVVITAFFIPNMLRKGTVDMLIVKPIHRVTLLLYKYVGGLLFILLNTTIAVVGIWVALSLRTGIWAPGFLISIPVITFFFAILYSVSTLFGVLTRSPIVCILMTCGVWFILFIVGTLNLVYQTIEKEQEAQVRRVTTRYVGSVMGMTGVPGAGGPLGAAAMTVGFRDPGAKSQAWQIFGRIVHTVHFILPRTSDLDALMTRMLQRDLLILPRGLGAAAVLSNDISWGESLTVSGVFIAVMLLVSCYWFATKDY